MIYWTLALRHLLVRPGRALLLLFGYALGVAVMMVLLSVGDAMLDQSRDASLVGGGELTALPEGVDIEALRNGGLTGMFFGIDGARFVSRQMIGGQRHAGVVAAISPVLEQKVVVVRAGHNSWPVRAGAEIPSAARTAGAGLRILAGRWADTPGDTAWRAPPAQVLYDEIDRFHLPSGHDSSWAEWDYFNLLVSEQEWWYITLLVGGDVHGARWGGQVLVTHRSANGRYHRFVSNVDGAAVRFDTTRADLTIGTASVVQRDGVYRVRGSAGRATFDIEVRPAPAHYLPELDIGNGRDVSGYAVAALTGTASGRLCAGGPCREVRNVAAYHDHNWGSWRAVTWEWGAGQGERHALLYGGVIGSGRNAVAVPFFLALQDSMGVQQVYRFATVERLGSRGVAGVSGISAPDSMRIVATHGADTLRLIVHVGDAAGSRSMAAGAGRVFLQMRGRWTAAGTAAGVVIADSGRGFFETWVSAPLRGER